MPNRFAHSPNLAITTLVNRELNDGPIRALLDQTNRCRRGLTILERDPFPQCSQRTAAHRALDFSEVLLFDTMTRVCDAIRKITVISEQQHPFGVGVEAPDREDARRLRNQIEHCWPAVRISRGRDDPCGFVQQVDHGVGFSRDSDAVDSDCGIGVNPLTEFSDHAVHGDTTVGN